jgi:hypothetical protein
MSTKTTLKRIALVAVSALGFGLMSVVPSKAATTFNASFTAPSSFTTVLGSTDSQAIGTVQLTATSTDATAIAANDTVVLTMTAATGSTSAQQAKNDALLPYLQLSTFPGSTNLNGTTGFNTLNNSAVAISGSDRVATMTPDASIAYNVANGQAYLRLLTMTSTQMTAASGGQVTFTLTAGSGGVITTFPQTFTLTVLESARALGTVVTTPASATTATTPAAIAKGGTSSFTHTRPYTGITANDTWTESVFDLSLSSGAAASSFTVTAAATGGTVNIVRDSATRVSATVVKDGTAGAFSVTYTVVVTASSSSTNSASITVTRSLTAGGTASTIWTGAVTPTTPVYSYSTAVPAPASTGFRNASGDGILWAAASDTAAVATVPVLQFDQTGTGITTNFTYKKNVVATITGKGSLAAVGSTLQAVKSSTLTLANGGLTAAGTNETFSIYSEGTSGEGTLTITVDGATVRTLTMRFWGDITKITATVLRPIGNGATGAANGQVGTLTNFSGNVPATVPTGVSSNTIETVGSCLTTTDCTVTSIAVTALDANNYPVPTGALVVASSDATVVTNANVALQFVDSGASDASTAVYSAGTFVRHYVYTPQVGASGKSSNVTFSIVNAAGTTVTSDAAKITLGGLLASGTLTFDKKTYQPGEVATITATGLDSAGNKAADGENLMAEDLVSTLNFTAPASFALVNGTRVRTAFSPLASGTWTITATDAKAKEYVATATVASPGAEAKAASDAATAAAEAASDAAAEAIDAANAATDAANLAAEAADAATVAAEEARDAADAATAAVEELATQVATLMAALKAQITTLANTVAKIAKKVKA